MWLVIIIPENIKTAGKEILIQISKDVISFNDYVFRK